MESVPSADMRHTVNYDKASAECGVFVKAYPLDTDWLDHFKGIPS